MTSLATLFHHDPATGMDLVPLPSNLVPMGTHGLDTCAALKSTSLTKMGELTQFLKQCDDPAYTVMYQNLLLSASSSDLMEFAQQLRNRARWLAAEETVEYKRASRLNILKSCTQQPPAPAPPASDAPTFLRSDALQGWGYARQQPRHVDAPTSVGMKRSSMSESPLLTDAPLLSHQLQNSTPVPGALDAEGVAGKAVAGDHGNRPAKLMRPTTVHRAGSKFHA